MAIGSEQRGALKADKRAKKRVGLTENGVLPHLFVLSEESPP